MQQITLKVTGMSCGHCVNTVEEHVGELAGVQDVTVHLDKGTVDVSFVPEEVNQSDIVEVIEAQGYSVA